MRLDDLQIPDEGPRSAVHLLGMLLRRALGAGATEIAIEVGRAGVHVRYRDAADRWIELERLPEARGQTLIGEIRDRSMKELSKSHFGLEGVLSVVWQGAPLDLYWETISTRGGETHVLKLAGSDSSA